MSKYIFLVEKLIGKSMEIIMITPVYGSALAQFKDGEIGIITKMEIGVDYSNGIGVCDHVHIGEDDVG